MKFQGYYRIEKLKGIPNGMNWRYRVFGYHYCISLMQCACSKTEDLDRRAIAMCQLENIWKHRDDTNWYHLSKKAVRKLEEDKNFIRLINYWNENHTLKGLAHN